MAILEGTELRNHLMNLDEFQLTWRKLERRLRDNRVVEILSRVDLPLDKKRIFSKWRICSKLMRR